MFIYRNTDFEELKTLFDIAQKLILEEKHEIKQVSPIEWHVTPRMRSTLPHDRVIKLSKARVHVYSDSVLCLGKMHPQLFVVDKWKEHLEYFQSTNEYKELFGTDEEPFGLEWNIFTGHTTVEILKEIQTKMAKRRNQTRRIRR